MTDTETNNIDITKPLTRKQFCLAENISMSTYAKMKRNGHGPKETHYPGMTLVRIEPEARRKWKLEREKWDKTEAAFLEEARRIALARAAGEKAATSPRHISKRGKRKKKATAEAQRKVKG
jgi:hypothetical protein